MHTLQDFFSHTNWVNTHSSADGLDFGKPRGFKSPEAIGGTCASGENGDSRLLAKNREVITFGYFDSNLKISAACKLIETSAKLAAQSNTGSSVLSNAAKLVVKIACDKITEAALQCEKIVDDFFKCLHGGTFDGPGNCIGINKDAPGSLLHIRARNMATAATTKFVSDIVKVIEDDDYACEAAQLLFYTEGNGPDACDADADGITNGADNCPIHPNPEQEDADNNGKGDACRDRDNDTILDDEDNCPDIANPEQEDVNDDNVGDACQDIDRDEILDGEDNCPVVYNPKQADDNNNGTGDVCEGDFDGDGVLDGEDNCPVVYNPRQADVNDDNVGDVCQGDFCSQDGDACDLETSA